MTTLRSFKVTSNKSKRTFTIQDQESKTKYRTIPMSVNEFNSCLYNTNGDWAQFLKSDDYYRI